MGRNWSSPAGNLYASTIVRLQAGDPPPASLGFVAAVALAEVLSLWAPEAIFQIKWPNDVLAAGAKISGILLERERDAIIIGMGANLASFPDGLDRPVTSIAALTGSAPDPAAFLDHLADCFARWLGLWRGQGARAIFNRWSERAHPRGTALRVSLPEGGTLDGLFDGLGPDGDLRLRLADGTHRAIHAGDIFLV